MNIKEAIEKEDYTAAVQILDDAFAFNPEDDAAAFYFCTVMLKTEHPGPARFILEQLVEKNPNKWQGWLNLGHAYDSLEMFDQAKVAFEKCLELNAECIDAVSGLASSATKQQRWEEAIEYSKKVLEKGDNIQATVNLGHAYLNTGDYEQGWKYYGEGVGNQVWRDKRDYGKPHYDGEKDARVVIYGEQGIGDQIAFMSALPDAIEQGLEVAAISCYPKLKNLFADTFKGIEVFGTQFNDKPDWISDSDFTHIMPMSWIQKFYRKSKESYTGKPYLKVNPAKSIQWKALLDSVSKRPKIGLSWTGGKRGSHSWKHKNIKLDDLQEILKVDGVDWICLEYKDHSEDIAWMHKENGLLIREWPWGTRTEDYSDTAALVANLDALVTVPTSVNHLAGGLGKEVHCFMSEKPHFHYGMGMPYYSSVHLYERTPEDVQKVKAAIEGLVRVKAIAA